MALRTRRLKLCAFNAALALLAAGGCNDPSRNAATAEGAAGERRIVALGRLEPAGGVLEIGAVPGDVLKRFADGVAEGAVVDAGAELAYLESYDLRATQLDAANAKLQLGERQRVQELAVAKANYERAVAAKAEADAKLEELNAQVEALENLAESARIAQADFQSLVDLRASDSELVTDIQFRRKQNEAERAVKEYEVKQRTHAAAMNAARAAVAAAQENVELAQVNARSRGRGGSKPGREDRKARRRGDARTVRAARSAPRGDAPPKYTVLKTFVEPGEFITQLPVFQIADIVADGVHRRGVRGRRQGNRGRPAGDDSQPRPAEALRRCSRPRTAGRVCRARSRGLARSFPAAG